MVMGVNEQTLYTGEMTAAPPLVTILHLGLEDMVRHAGPHSGCSWLQHIRRSCGQAASFAPFLPYYLPQPSGNLSFLIRRRRLAGPGWANPSEEHIYMETAKLPARLPAPLEVLIFGSHLGNREGVLFSPTFIFPQGPLGPNPGNPPCPHH